MLFIGDVHGKINEYFNIIKKLDKTIQLGDFGVGFVKIPKIPKQHRFIRGNHDNPEECKKFTNYLGNYGYLKKEEIFFISGAFSIDKSLRTEGVDWWRDEELSYAELNEMTDLYYKIHPQIVVSHEAPKIVINKIWGHNYYNNPTVQALNVLFEYNQPKIWVFGHHHKSFREKIGKTFFIGLDELEIYNMEEK